MKSDFIFLVLNVWKNIDVHVTRATACVTVKHHGLAVFALTVGMANAAAALLVVTEVCVDVTPPRA